MVSMSPAESDAFLRETRIGKLSYLQANGQPTIVPIWFEWDGTVARIFTGKATHKAKRLAEEPRVALSVEEPVGVHERWVTIEGRCAISSEGTVGLVERLARRYYAPEQAEAAIRDWTANPEHLVTLTITPTKIRSSR